MKILYGVCGEGFGHSSRAKTVLDHLKQGGHEVLLLTYGQAYETLKEFNPVNIFGIEIEYKKGKMSILRSYLKNRKTFYRKLKDYPKLRQIVNDFSPEVCISDMEPIVPILSFWKNLPLISIDNQHSLIFSKLKVPLNQIKDYFLAKRVVRRCITNADYFFILSFLKIKTQQKNVFFVSPLLRDEIIKLKPTSGNFTLVYLSKPDDNLIKTLQKTKQKYIIYGQKNSGKTKYITYKKKGKAFVSDLKKCKAIVATSGFSLMSEALYLKKPYFAIPLKGQFEQMANSLFLRDSGFGEYSINPTKEDLEHFSKNYKNYKQNLKDYSSNPSEALKRLDKALKKIKRQ
jgi:uncharacterized protein (TIGR00661 family)